ncbi:MAG: type I-B CRISPR-associated protein Cas8b1/Cst1 [Deltaproteobacteria bacterium]|jgi:CRISPR-associated protein Cst1|nr:type I-B CRISPR-associated protein Cas8b1/Cst1 [Deltaproteobacteria bacterium]
MSKLSLTGDPFVDMGGLVMETIPEKTIEDKIRFATDVYVDGWKGKVDSIFLLSKLNNNHVKNKPDLQREGTLEYYLGALKDDGAISEGHCRVCAFNGHLFKGGRNNYPLVGSGEFTNFHHFQEPGLLICKDCLIKLFFLPLGILQSAGNLMFLQIKNEYEKKLWQKDVILNNLDKISHSSSAGILKSKYTNPQNALFYFASSLITCFELYDYPPLQVRLFYFTNFGSKPDIEIHDLPSPVFSFLKRVLKPDLRPHWSYFIKRHYQFRKTVNFDEDKNEWVEVKKKNSISLDIDNYAGTNKNTIHYLLLSGKSILGRLRKIYKQMEFPVYIAIAYLKEVRKMKQEQIDLIKKISEKIITLAENAKNYKKFITPIEGAKYGHQLRGAIIRMVKEHYKNGEQEPFVRFNDYVEYLFPDGQSWYEVRDFLLISLYDKLHQLRIEPDKISDDEIPDIEEINRSSIEVFNS